MLEEITSDNLKLTKASNQEPFDRTSNYSELLNAKNKAKTDWQGLTSEEREKYGDLQGFEKSHGISDLNDTSLIPGKNTHLLLKEIKERLDREDPLSPLGIEPLDFEDATLELAESLENINEIRDLYKLRKASVGTSRNAGISASEAAKLKNCFNQGRELFSAGRHGSLMVKPLNFFYALTAYTYGIIILNNPLRYRKDMLPGSHGMAYLPATLQGQFGGDCPRGTFSDLVGAFPTQLINSQGVNFNIDCSNSIIEFYKTRFEVSLGTLLSMVPEMADYYKLTTGRDSRCFPLQILNANDPRNLIWEFHIGNGETRPHGNAISSAFDGLDVSERHGKIIVTVPATQTPQIEASIFTDIHGKLWFIDTPFYPILLPEVAVHFLITSIFSNIMRYRPDEWGSVLLNEVSSSISLLTRHYFSSFQRKFLLLVLRSTSRYLPFAL